MLAKKYVWSVARFFLILVLLSGTQNLFTNQSRAVVHALGTPGSLDTTFDEDGLVTTPIGNYHDEARSVAIQPDGKIVVAGGFSNPTYDNFLVIRYNNDGSLDTGFSTDGIVTTDFGGDDVAQALAIQSDGRIIVAGYTSPNGSTADFALARYNVDGSLDTSFDSDGKLITSLGDGYDLPSAIAVQPDGKIIVVGGKDIGINNYDVAVLRYNPNGTLDTTFDTDGIAITPVGSGGYDFGASVAIQSDGKIVVGGSSYDPVTNINFLLIRYNDDGTLDASFDSNGIVTMDFGIGMGFDRGGHVALQPDGKIVVAGYSDDGYFLLARYEDNGLLDTYFGSSGVVATYIGGGYDNIRDIALQPSGKIVIAGYSWVDNDFALARYNNDGSPDQGFGIGGLVSTDFGSDQDDLGNSIAIQEDGRIIVAGYRYIGGSNYDVAIARYLGGEAPKTHYVKWNATGANNGTSWNNAYTDLQSALSAATSGDEIRVAAGTYKPTTGKDRTISFTLKSGVEIYGGFAGDISGNVPNPSTNVTILSGDIGDAGNNADNSFHVVTSSATDKTAVLDGFTITGGNADGDGINSSTSDGGGIYNKLGSPTIRNVVFSNNSATYGGGMYSEGDFSGMTIARPTLTNVIFTNNTGGDGGGMENRDYIQPTLTNVAFISNTSHNAGGGMLNLNHCDSTLVNVTFAGNTAALSGGGIDNIGSNSTLTNVTFKNNSSREWGGGMDNAGNSTVTLTNVTINGNSAATFGGAISNQVTSTLTLTNVTIIGNSAGTFGDGVYNENSSNSDIRNSILYGNGEEIYGTSNVTYSIIQGGYTGTGNLTADPQLHPLASNGGFTQTMALKSSSPAIDAGSDSICPGTDQRNVSRPQGFRCDMGAFEFGSSIPMFAWNTFQGGALAEYASDVAIDQQGNIYVTGSSESALWEGNPISPAAGGVDAFVAKFNPDGQLLWYTFLGSGVEGYDHDNGATIKLDENGYIFVGGASDSSWGNNPVHAFTGDINSDDTDIFVAKLNSNGALLWHTFLGGNGYDFPHGIALNANGEIYITGSSGMDWGATVLEPILPFSEGFYTRDAFVAKLSPSGALQWHTFVGGVDDDSGEAIAVDTRGNIYTTGTTETTWGNLPIRDHSGESDAFVAKFSSSGNILWNTFLGGSLHDMGMELTTDSFGNIFTTGNSSSSWGVNPIHPYSSFGDGFLAKLTANGDLEWNTFFGGPAFDYGGDLVVNDTDHSVTVIGASEVPWGAPSFPYNGDGKYFLAQFHSSGVFQWNAFFGEPDIYGLSGGALAIRDENIVAIGWSTNSWGTPVHAHNNNSDIYVLKLKSNDNSTQPPITPVIPTPRPPIPHPVMKSQALTPSSLTTQFGTTSGSSSSLSQLDQSEADDDPAAYVSFQTPEGVYLGEQSFFLPEDAQTRLISTMLLQLNFKGPTSPTQVWTWSIYDPNSGMWIKVGDSVGAEADQWQNLIFRIRQPWRFVAGNEIRIQLKSNNANGDAKIDYQALHVTYLSIPTALTPVTPPVTPRRPGTFSE